MNLDDRISPSKKVTISAFLPELAAGHAWQESEGEGSNLAVAIKRAIDDLMRKPKIKGHHLTALKLTISVVK